MIIINVQSREQLIPFPSLSPSAVRHSLHSWLYEYLWMIYVVNITVETMLIFKYKLLWLSAQNCASSRRSNGQWRTKLIYLHAYVHAKINNNK